MFKTVGFYGNSDCAYRGDNSYIDLFALKHKLEIVNTGVKQGSEERILYELKKTPELDLAVIFHSEPQYLFLPGCDRDIGLNHLREHRAQYLFENWDIDFNRTHNSKFLEKFGTPQRFMDAISTYKEFYYTPDLQMNRFTGALIQIDQYCTAKNIAVIHIWNNAIPNWFKFSSGIINKDDILDIFKQHKIEMGTFNPNGITDVGNELVCERLTELAESMTPSPGRLAERSIASISKIDNPDKGFVGSNPTPSAI